MSWKRYRPVVIGTVLAAALAGCTDGNSAQKKENEPASSAQAAPAAELKTGTDGQKVKALQQDLKTLGYQLDATGAYDAETKKAIKDFQAQNVEMAATGVYDDTTRAWLDKALQGKFDVKAGKGLTERNISSSPDKSITVHNPKDMLVLVNKNHALPDGYEPPDLTAPNVRFPFTEDLPKKYMRKTAAKALEDLFKAGDKAGVQLYGQSGYRSYERQVSVFGANVKSMGEKKANQVSARPGESEHQTGLAMDVTSADVNFRVDEDFGDTKEGKWLKDHAHEYGFIIRYLKGKEATTRYSYEPWHIRYVGPAAAKVMYEKHLTLEEYLGAAE